MYQIETIFTQSNNLAQAIKETESKLIKWMRSEDKIKLLSVANTCVVDDQNSSGKFIYIYTVLYSY